MRRRLILKIYGDVQGIGFRYQVREFSKKNSINGIVKNETDGTVFICAEGEEKDLFHLLDYCHNGLRYARVENIDVRWEKARGEFISFTIE